MDAAMDRIPVRELRNNVSEVLRRVEAGETLEITVNDRPVALLGPRVRRRPRTAPTATFLARLRQADPGLRDELAELGDSTDDLDDPWLAR